MTEDEEQDKLADKLSKKGVFVNGVFVPNRKVKYELNPVILQKAQFKLEDSCGMPMKRFIEAAMEAFVEGSFEIRNGKFVTTKEPIINVIQQKNPVGAPRKDKEQKEEPLKPFKLNKEDPWNTDCSNLKYGDLPERRWPIKERGDEGESILLSTIGPITGNDLEDFMFNFYLDERPKFTNKQWEDSEYDLFLGRVAWMFILKNKLKNYRFDEEVIRDYASDWRQYMDNNMLSQGSLKEEEE